MVFQEQYLLQSRNHRIPYKRIASRLQKSELACRLHYHQLTVVKQRVNVGAEGSWEDDDETDYRPLLQVCHSSPTTPEPMLRLLTPPPDVGWHTPSLPGVNALLDTAWHRRTASAPEPNRRYSMAASLPVPPANVTGLIPPQRLLSPFDPNRLMPRLERELPAPLMAYANYSPSFVGLTPPSTLPSYSPIMTTKTPPMLTDMARRPTTGRAYSVPAWNTPHISVTPSEYQNPFEADRTSVHALLNHDSPSMT